MGRGRIDRRPQFRPDGRQQKGGDARMKRNLLVLAGKVPRANSRRNSDQGEIDEALFNTAKLTSWLLDMSLPVERGGLNEVHYDIVCVYSGDELPEEGTVMLADRVLAPVLLARTAAGAGALGAAMRRTLRRIDPGVVFWEGRTLRDNLASQLLAAKLLATTTGTAGLVAIGLATIGLYGVVAFAIVRRTHEIVVRAAMGASRGDVLRLVLRQAIPLGIGTVIGGVSAYALARATAGVFHGVNAADVTAWGVALLVLVAAGATAHADPVLWAVRVRPAASPAHRVTCLRRVPGGVDQSPRSPTEPSRPLHSSRTGAGVVWESVGAKPGCPRSSPIHSVGEQVGSSPATARSAMQRNRGNGP